MKTMNAIGRSCLWSALALVALSATQAKAIVIDDFNNDVLSAEWNQSTVLSQAGFDAVVTYDTTTNTDQLTYSYTTSTNAAVQTTLLRDDFVLTNSGDTLDVTVRIELTDGERADQIVGGLALDSASETPSNRDNILAINLDGAGRISDANLTNYVQNVAPPGTSAVLRIQRVTSTEAALMYSVDNGASFETLGGDGYTYTVPGFNALGFFNGNARAFSPTSSAVFDNLTLTNVFGTVPAELMVRADTGEMQFVNRADESLSVNFYRIDSIGSSLDVGNWNSLDAQNIDLVDGPDAEETAGDSPGESWDEAGGVGPKVLSEAFLLGESTLAAGEKRSLGKGYNDTLDARDLVFKYGVPGVEELGQGAVVYISGGDMNGDGSVDDLDVDPFVQALTNRANYEAAFPEGDADFVGDFNGNGVLDLGDLQGFKSAVQGSGSSQSTTVPEPGAFSLLCFALISFLPIRNSRRKRLTVH